ncbi:MAG: NUDIX domain-containing protein, partial [Nevskiales bacterium]
MKHAVVDAVTAVFTCGEQGFITVRSPEMPAFPGYHAFPGGKVDASDPETAIDLPWLRDHEPKLMHALCRELDEEVGFDLR